MANRKFILSSATKRKLDWLKAQWINETGMIEIYTNQSDQNRSFLPHNRALLDLYPDSYRLLFTTGSFTLTTSPFSNEPGVQRVQRSNMLEG